MPLRGDRMLRSCWPDAPISSTRTPVIKCWPDGGRVRSLLTRHVLVALNPHWNLTVLDRTLNPQGPVSTYRTRSVTDSLLWNLTGVDRTLPLNVWSLDHSSVRSHQTGSPQSNELTGPCGQRPVAPEPASGQCLTLHSLPTFEHMWMKFAPKDLRHS